MPLHQRRAPGDGGWGNALASLQGPGGWGIGPGGVHASTQGFLLQEALAHTRTSIADTEDVLAATQELPPEPGDHGNTLPAKAMDEIARNRAAAMERKRLKEEERLRAEPKTDTCAVCHQIMFLEDVDQLQWLPCTHVFHADCIGTWADTRNLPLELACPLCKNTTLEVPGFVPEVTPEIGDTVPASASGASGSHDVAPMSAGQQGALTASASAASGIL